MAIPFRNLPKVLLHDHLDGGLRPQTIIDLAPAHKLELPETNAAALGKWFLDSANSGSLERYLETFQYTVGVMQTPAALTRVAYEAVLDLAADGVIYAELRWAPEQHQMLGLTLDEAVAAVQDGLEQGMEQVENDGGFIRTGQILSAMRQSNRSLEIAELAVQLRDDGVIGFDIAGPEAGFPPAQHRLAFDYLAQELMPVTVHAGEAAGIDSIKDALVSGRALRLGHGVQLAEDILHAGEEGDVMKAVLGPVAQWVHDRSIALELSPSSNVQTGAFSRWGDQLTDHPFDVLYDLGFEVTVNTDNRLMSGTSVTRELRLLSEAFGYGMEDLLMFQLNAAQATFQGQPERDELIEMIEMGFAENGL